MIIDNMSYYLSTSYITLVIFIQYYTVNHCPTIVIGIGRPVHKMASISSYKYNVASYV